MKKIMFYAGLATCLLSGIALADPVFTYTLQLPTISAGQEVDSNFTDYAFSWVGPLSVNAGPNTSCPTVCGPVIPGSTVKSGESFYTFAFTANLSLNDPVVLVKFSDFSGADFASSNTITFSITEPDSFWSTTGSNISFPTLGGAGANFSIGGTDPACTGCTISISESAATPEPRSAILLATLMAAAGFFVQRRRRQARAIG